MVGGCNPKRLGPAVAGTHIFFLRLPTSLNFSTLIHILPSGFAGQTQNCVQWLDGEFIYNLSPNTIFSMIT
jgi:hypothetical protein